MRPTKTLFLYVATLLIGVFSCQNSYAQGIKGTIKNTKGEALPFANIYVKGTSIGTVSNEQGYYELKLSEGKQTVVFQFMGYETQTKSIEITADYQEINVNLTQSAIMMSGVTVGSGNEDPSYTIMRKAIAKSKFHLLQVENYNAKVYIKGRGRLKGYPWLLAKKIEKEGVDSNMVFLTESVTELYFEQPNTYHEKVIAIRSSGTDNESASPNQYINGSFYEPQIAETISPLSPKAFRYYRFKYEGSFDDQGNEINKIKVIPRVRGEGVFEGYIYIVEDKWCLHSLNLKTARLGFRFHIEQVLTPIGEEKVWMPVSHQFDVMGGIMGFDVEYKYIATVSEYDLTLNPNLVEEPIIIGEKIEKEMAESLKKIEVKDKSKDELENILAQDKPLTRKSMRKVMRELEKREQEEYAEEKPDSVDIISNQTLVVDSIAKTRDSLFWVKIRPVPLTLDEIQSEIRADSINLAKKEEAKKDSLKKEGIKKSKFSLGDLLTDQSLKWGKHTRLLYRSPLQNNFFNTVEGIAMFGGLGLKKYIPISKEDSLQKVAQKQSIYRKSWELLPVVRYSFAREKWSGKVHFLYQYNRKSEFRLEGGRYVEQLNNDRPILPIVNSLMTLFLEQNLMKLYEHDFVRLNWQHRFSDAFSLESRLTYAQRTMLQNNSNYKLINRPNHEYTSNAPRTTSEGRGSFDAHHAVTLDVQGSLKPFLKYSVYNGRKRVIDKSSSTFSMRYRKGLNILGSETNFDQLEAGYRHSGSIGQRADWDLLIKAGVFLNQESLFFS